MTPNDNEYLDILQAAHSEPLDPAHYTAVRARVLAEIERTRTPWRRLAWLSGVGTLAACLLFAIWFQRRPEAPRPRAVVFAIPPAPAPVPVVYAAHVERARAARPRREPLTIKLQTSDPNIVIYWIAD